MLVPKGRRQVWTAGVPVQVVVTRLDAGGAVVDLGQNGIDLLEAVIIVGKERPAVNASQVSLFSIPRGTA